MVKKFSGGFGLILAQISLFSPYFANIWVIQLKKILAARLLNYGRLFFFKKKITMLAFSDWSPIRNVIVGVSRICTNMISWLALVRGIRLLLKFFLAQSYPLLGTQDDPLAVCPDPGTVGVGMSRIPANMIRNLLSLVKRVRYFFKVFH